MKPDDQLAKNDSGADSNQRDRYQAVCVANECLRLLQKDCGLDSIICEQEDDFLVRTLEHKYYAIQVKTKRGSLLTATDTKQVIEPIRNFVRLEREYSDQFIQFRLVTNHGFETFSGEKKYKDLQKVIDDARSNTITHISEAPIAGVWWTKCFKGKDPDIILKVLGKLHLDFYGDFAAAENDFIVGLGHLEECHFLSTRKATLLARQIIGEIQRRSIKDLDTAKRHLSLYSQDPKQSYELACVEQRRLTPEMLTEIIRNFVSQNQTETHPTTDIGEVLRILRDQTHLLKTLSPDILPAQEDDSDELHTELKAIRSKMDSGKYREAEREYVALTARKHIDKSSLRKIYINSGVCHLVFGEYETAHESFQKALLIDATDCLAMAHTAQLQIILGEYEEALRTTSNAIVLDSKHEFACCVHVMALHLNGLRQQMDEFIQNNSWISDTVHGLLVLGQISLIEGRPDEAERNFRQIIDREPNNSQAIDLLASVLYKKLDATDDGIGKFEFTDLEFNSLREIATLYEKLITVLAEQDVRSNYAHALINHSSILGMLDRLDEADADINEALRLFPNHHEALRMKGNLLIRRKSFSDAIPILRRARDGGAEVTISLAAALLSCGLFEDALHVLSNQPPDGSTRSLVSLDMSAACYRGLGRSEKLQSVLDLIDAFEPKTIDSHLVHAHQLRLSGEIEQSIEVLRSVASDDTLTISQASIVHSHLAQSFYALHRYQEALEQFDLVTTYNLKRESMPFIITALANIGKLYEAWTLAKDSQNQGNPGPLTVEVEATISMLVGDYSRCEVLFRNLITEQPHEPRHRLGLTKALLGQNRRDDAIAHLDAMNSSFFGNPRLCLEIASIFAYLAQPERALEIAYEGFRRNPNNPTAYQLYVSLFFGTPSECALLERAEIIAPDTVVVLQDLTTSRERTFVVMNTDEVCLDSQEISCDEQLGSRLMGKKVGDIVEVGPNVHFQIKEVKNKFVAALHRAMQDYETRFPESQGMRSFSEHQEAIMMAAADERASLVNHVLTAYENCEVPLALTAQLLGKTIPELWHGLISSGQTKFRCWDGNPHELDLQFQLVSNPVLIMDLSALFSMAYLGHLDKIAECYSRIIVPTFVLDDLGIALAKLRDNRRVTALLMRSTEGYQIQYQSIELVHEFENLLNSICTFVHSKTELLTTYKCLSEGRDKFKYRFQCFGGTGLIGGFLAADIGDSVFFSDDLLLRSSTTNQLNISSTWSYPILRLLRRQNALTEHEWFDSLFKLSVANYSILPMTADFLFWMLTNHFLTATNDVRKSFANLEDLTISEESLIEVLCALLKLIWTNELIETQRLAFVDLIAAVLVRRNVSDTFLRLLFSAIDSNMQVLGIASIELKENLTLAINVLRTTCGYMSI